MYFEISVLEVSRYMCCVAVHKNRSGTAMFFVVQNIP